MKKLIKILYVILMLLILNTHISEVFASSDNVNIYINDSYVSTDVSAYISNRRTYVPVRFVAEKLGAKSISWDQDTLTATVSFESNVFKFKIKSNIIYVNGNPVRIDVPVEIKNSRTFVPIRFITEQMGYTVNWESSTKSVKIFEKNYAANYSQEDIYWLSRIIEAEASGEPYSGKLGVANVIINRKESSLFPNTIKKVIFDNKYGIQFTPVSNGKIYNTPSSESIKAAKVALDGKNNVGNSLYFLNPNKATHNWITRNRDFYISISNHDFYI